MKLINLNSSKQDLIEYIAAANVYEPGGENQLIIQQEHDRRKREYAFSNGYEFIEIPYWEYDNIENILCNKMKEVI